MKKTSKLLSLLAIGIMALTGCGGTDTGGGGGDDTGGGQVTPPSCEHNYQWVSDGEAGHHEECSLCHDKHEIVPHRWDDGTPGTGVILYECLDCGETKTEIVEVFAAAGVYNFDSLTAGNIEERTKLAEGVYLNASSSYKFTIDASAKAYTPEGATEVTSVNRMKANGASQNGGDRTIEINMEKAGRIIAYTMTSSSSDLTRKVALWNDMALVTTEGAADAYEISGNYEVGNAVEAKEFQVVEKGKYYVGCCGNASNFYAIQIIYDTCAHEFTTTAGRAATCGLRGTTIYTCAKCGTSVEVANIARAEHTWDDVNFVHADGMHWHECTVCHAVHGAKEACTADPEHHHDADEPTADNPITYQEDTCSVCGGTWQHDPREYVAPDQKEFTVADASKWTSTTSATEHVLSDNCSYMFASAAQLKTGTDAANQTAFKLDPPKNASEEKYDPNMSAWVDRYFVVTGCAEGDVIRVTANSGGSNRGIKFGFTEADQVAVPKSTTVEGCTVIEHTVTADEATNGVKFAPYSTNTLFVVKVVWVQK